MKNIITLGPNGSYSDKATKQMLSHMEENYVLSYVGTKDEIIPSIKRDYVNGVVFPLQNKIIGDVGLHYLDYALYEILQSKKNIKLRGSLNLRLHFGLCGNPKSKTVHVHPVAQKQCSVYLADSGYTVKFSNSNSQALIDALAEDALAISDVDFINENGLEVISDTIQNELDNQTRFLYLGEPIDSPVLDTSNHVYFARLNNEVGSLSALVSSITSQGINIEELIVRRRDCSNPRLGMDGMLVVCDSPLELIEGYDIQSMGSFGLNWS